MPKPIKENVFKTAKIVLIVAKSFKADFTIKITLNLKTQNGKYLL